MTVRVRSARFQVGPSSDVDAPLMPTAASAKHPAAATPISAAGSRALPRTSRSRFGAASQATPAVHTRAATHPSGSSDSPSATVDTIATRITSVLAYTVPMAKLRRSKARSSATVPRIWMTPAPAMIGQKRGGVDGIGSPTMPNVTNATISASGKPYA